METDAGTPQGGLVSPVLANIYLHYTLDWWFEGRFAKTCRGTAHLVRYADDFVACFERQDDAERFLKTVAVRLGTFGLEVEPTKTALLRFGRFALQNCFRDGRKRPATFSFLGLTHYVGKSRTGAFVVGRRTDRKRIARKLKDLSHRLQGLRNAGGKAMVTYVQQHLRGHMQYYGVSGNSAHVRRYFWQASRTLFKWLNRRSQRRSMKWSRFSGLLKDGLLPTPRTVHQMYPVPTRRT